ncbi:CopG family transcriptional regulator [Streptomyces sp. TRM66268-LWL]|uniref:CopG family transcriptional regulator n=1 Tax=Streptomyces polyasparticus TaxID=2767826 RepID=A0ABR7SUI7_9ACTN|nr:CopG family transcriptional regulator [Streptomyces polyasparticus]MBC9719164.1 CopG family transcriptional regulator [Streptomyces polyasparticus]
MAWTMRLPEAEETALAQQAATEGRSKQDITRDAVRLYLMRHRKWEEPMDLPSFDLGGDPVTRDEIRKAVTQGVAERQARNA